MINTTLTHIEVPPFDIKTILAFNAILWLAIAGIVASFA